MTNDPVNRWLIVACVLMAAASLASVACDRPDPVVKPGDLTEQLMAMVPGTPPSSPSVHPPLAWASKFADAFRPIVYGEGWDLPNAGMGYAWVDSTSGDTLFVLLGNARDLDCWVRDRDLSLAWDPPLVAVDGGPLIHPITGYRARLLNYIELGSELDTYFRWPISDSLIAQVQAVDAVGRDGMWSNEFVILPDTSYARGQ